MGGGLLDWQQEVTGSPVMGRDLGAVAEKDGSQEQKCGVLDV